MANTVMPTALKAFLDGDIDLLSDDIAIVLISEDYVFDIDDEFLGDITGSYIVADEELGNKATTAGVFTADDVDFVDLTGDPVQGYFLVQDTGTPATSRLIGWVDEYESTEPIAFEPDGTTYPLKFGTLGVFSL